MVGKRENREQRRGQRREQRAVVALIRGMVRYDNVLKALGLLTNALPELGDKIGMSQWITVVPDFSKPSGLHNALPNATTHVDAVRAALDFITQYTNKRITIAARLFDGSSAQKAFHNAQFHELHEQYSLRFVDLKRDSAVAFKTGRFAFKMPRTLADSNFIVSVAAPVVWQGHLHGSLASFAVSARVHDTLAYFGQAALAALITKIKPSLSVIDGSGNFAVASEDCVAADAIAARLLRASRNAASYLTDLSSAGLGTAELSKINVLGEQLR